VIKDEKKVKKKLILTFERVFWLKMVSQFVVWNATMAALIQQNEFLVIIKKGLSLVRIPLRLKMRLIVR